MRKFLPVPEIMQPRLMVAIGRIYIDELRAYVPLDDGIVTMDDMARAIGTSKLRMREDFEQPISWQRIVEWSVSKNCYFITAAWIVWDRPGETGEEN